MSILIKDMNMPTSCPCELIGNGYDMWCSFAAGIPARVKEYDECCQNGTRPSWCPLIPVPPHGRLIDASEKIRVQIYDDMTEDYHMVEMTVDDLLSQGWVEADAPTIIEAEEEET